MEGGAIVHYKGLYYAIGSALTGWTPNPNKYATARTLEGPWSEFRDIAPPEAKTYGSQSTMLLKVVGTKATTVIFMGDIWKPRYAVGLALSLDAGRDRRRQTLAARTQAVDSRHQDRRSLYPLVAFPQSRELVKRSWKRRAAPGFVDKPWDD